MPSSESDPQPSSDRVTPLGIDAGVGLIPHFVWLSAAMCGAFAVVAGIAITGYLILTDFAPESGLYFRMATKIVLLAGVSLGAVIAGMRAFKTFPPKLRGLPLRPSASLPKVTALLLLALFALLLYRLDDYPWTAPDELHHLIVAHNLAEHDAYASGHPDGELLYFDPYDSVGPSVIVPVATAMRASSEKLIAARVTVAALFVSWIAMVYAFLRPVFGGRAAAVSAVLAATSFSSIYFARSLYGEVPALLYLVAGLLIWRRALAPNASSAWGVLAGSCFAFAVLAKTFMLLCAFPMAAAFFFDRLTQQKVRWRDVLIPFAVMMSIVTVWVVYSGSRSTADNAQDSFVHLYRHYLMFGFDGVRQALSWIVSDWKHLLAIAGGLVGVVAVLPLIAVVRYDPPLLVLLLVGVLFAFWWLFFTPGTIPRYLWYSLAIGAALCGPIVLASFEVLREPATGKRTRFAALVILIVMLAPPIDASRYELQRIFVAEEMVDEHALSAYIQSSSTNPPPTTSWMAQRSANFFSDTWLVLIEPGTEPRTIRDTYLEEFATETTESLPGTERYRIERIQIEETFRR